MSSPSLTATEPILGLPTLEGIWQPAASQKGTIWFPHMIGVTCKDLVRAFTPQNMAQLVCLDVLHKQG